MNCTRIFREKNEFYLEIFGRWWNADSETIRPYYGLSQPLGKGYPFKNEEERPPYKTWHQCSKLDYLTVFGRILEKDVEVVVTLITEAWKTGCDAGLVRFMGDKAFLNVRERPREVNPPNQVESVVMFGSSRHERTIEIPY